MRGENYHLDNETLEALASVGERLRDIGYNEENVRLKLGVEDLHEIRLSSYPFYLHERLGHREPLDLAIKLFLLQEPLTRETLGLVFSRGERRALRHAHIVSRVREADTLRAALSLYAVGSTLFFTDHRFTHDPWLRARRPEDPVMYLGPDTYYLSRIAFRRQTRVALDLGSGCGIHTVLAAGHAERAVGVDVNPRAVAIARINTAINGYWNAVFLEGDLFRPVSGERFGLILANPPFVPSPVYELRYRDGGPSGADVLRRIIAGIPDYLAAGGYAQIVTHVGERDGETYTERLRRWLGGANMNMHALKLGEDTLEEYVVAQTRTPFAEGFTDYGREARRWLNNLRAQRFKRVIGVVLTFEWNDDLTVPPWTQEDEAKPPREAIWKEVEAIFRAKRRVRGPDALQRLDRAVVGVPDDMILVERKMPAGVGFTTKEIRVTWKRPALTPELEVKPLIRDLLQLADNISTVPEIIQRYAKERGLTVESVDGACRRAFLAMLERGLVTLDEVSEVAAAVVESDDERPRAEQEEARKNPLDALAVAAGESGEPEADEEAPKEPEEPAT